MGLLDFMKRPKTLDETQEEVDRTTIEKQKWDNQRAIWESRAAIAELKRRGQDPNAFREGGKFNLAKAWAWLKSH